MLFKQPLCFLGTDAKQLVLEWQKRVRWAFNCVLTEHNQDKMNHRKTIFTHKELQKQTLQHTGLWLGGEMAVSNVEDVFVGEGSCLISALKANWWSDKWKFVSL